MPGISTDASPRILQRLELQTLRADANRGTVTEQERLVSRDEMGEWSALPNMAMEPESPIHRVDHSVAPLFEFSKRWWVGRSRWSHLAFGLLAGHHPGDGRRRDG